MDIIYMAISEYAKGRGLDQVGIDDIIDLIINGEINTVGDGIKLVDDYISR